MKSRIWILTLMLTIAPSLIVSAQVLPLGRVQTRGQVQPASCATCGPTAHGFYDGAVWGTSCPDCQTHPGLFPPCPNPCQTTLLGELVCDVKLAVDTGLATIFDCLFGGCGFPCGCQDVCVCESSGCGMSGVGCESCDSSEMSTIMQPQQATPTPAYAPNPFGDDPNQGSGLKPMPNKAAARSRLPGPRLSLSRGRARTTVQRATHTAPMARPAGVVPATLESAELVAEPLAGSTGAAAGHYQPRKTTSLRKASGAELKLAPLRGSATPALRFR